MIDIALLLAGLNVGGVVALVLHLALRTNHPRLGHLVRAITHRRKATP